jgi:GWxTD domain-containing protein
MKFLVYILILCSSALNAQALREMNFKYWYNSESPVLKLRPIREASRWICYYGLEARDTSANISGVELTWQLRKSLNDKDGISIPSDNVTREVDGVGLRGTVATPFSGELQFLVAKLSDPSTKQSRYFYTPLEPNLPETQILHNADGKAIIERFSKPNTPLLLNGPDPFFAAHYDDNFPTAPLAFSEAIGKVSKQMKIDSTFMVRGSEAFKLNNPGLYLIQRDTASTEGIALRVEADYPRYTKLRSLAAPLIYICTSQEYERIRLAGNDKKAFDKVILGITKDPDRAKKMFRSYFKRVESANEYFTSYKEGWKTDRGMIFIIFGPPDEVFRYADREVWNYKTTEFKVDFEFIRSPSLFDPFNYVLIRERKYKEIWYEVIDLWRNARY